MELSATTKKSATSPKNRMKAEKGKGVKKRQNDFYVSEMRLNWRENIEKHNCQC